MRKVKVGYDPKHVFEGWFHGFSNAGNLEEGLHATAIIEDEKGRLCEVGIDFITFIKQPKKEETK